MELFTIGFTHKTAEQFFGLLNQHQVTVVVDIRLKPEGQLNGFARKQDLPYFLRKLANCAYEHRLEMAPEASILSQYRQDKSWANYETAFKALLEKRHLIQLVERAWWESQRACLLCSEHEPDFCHRRLVAEYLAQYWEDTTIHHLM